MMHRSKNARKMRPGIEEAADPRVDADRRKNLKEVANNWLLSKILIPPHKMWRDFLFL
jgi:hypothetical protein